MKKSFSSIIIPLAIFSFVVAVFVTGPMNVSAQTNVAAVNCPAGYTCTPMQPISYYSSNPNMGGGDLCPTGQVWHVSSCVSAQPTSYYASNPNMTGTSCYQYSANLTIGSNGADVVALQTALMSKGFDIPAISYGAQAKGYFGSQTMAALKRYQNNFGINENYFGQVTRANLNSCGSPANPVQSSITVLSPKTNDQLIVKVPTQISWIGNFERGDEIFEISLVDSNGKDYIATVPFAQASCKGSSMGQWAKPSTCTYSWIPTYLSPSAKVVVSQRNTTKIGYSGSFLVSECPSGYTCGNQITQPSINITVLSPNGGEVWIKGTTQNITWTSPYYFRATNVDLKLVPAPLQCPSGYSCIPNYPSQYIIASNISANQNSFSWHVGDGSYPIMSLCGPNDPTPLDSITHLPILGSTCNRGNATTVARDDQYKIQICETGTNNCDLSNNYFTLTSSPTSTYSR